MRVLLRAHVRRVAAIPYYDGAQLLHDEVSGPSQVIWVTEARLTAAQATQLEDDINRASLQAGRRLTPAEVRALLPG